MVHARYGVRRSHIGSPDACKQRSKAVGTAAQGPITIVLNVNLYHLSILIGPLAPHLPRLASCVRPASVGRGEPMEVDVWDSQCLLRRYYCLEVSLLK